MCVRGEMLFVLSRCLVQVGDGTGTNRLTPVAVVGLGSGVANVASGGVRLFVQRVCCIGAFGGALVVVLLRGLCCCRVLGLQFGGAQRLAARFGWGGLWCDEGCARRSSCMVYSGILALF